MNDTLGAFCDETIRLPGATSGPLAGLSFGAKDVFDIAGHRTGAGSPDWLRTHPPAQTTASAVLKVVAAGATLVGKTQTDELTFSLNGENAHYGTPHNPNAPGRIPGGSSSGSASAVAGELVEFALGTDTGGSVRLPASYCGITGFRPTHGRVPNDHVVPLAPSFDTVGWFARDAGVLQRVGRVLLDSQDPGSEPSTLLLAGDAFDLVCSNARPALSHAAEGVAEHMASVRKITLFNDGPDAWMECFRRLQGLEIWRRHGAWVRRTRPAFGADIKARFEWAASLNPGTAESDSAIRQGITRHLDELLGSDRILCIPTSPSIAPLKNTAGVELEKFRQRALSLLCVAGLARLPQVSLPLASHDDCPLGISLVGPRNSDEQLLALAARLMEQ